MSEHPTKIENLPGSISVDVSLGQTVPKIVGIPEGRIIQPGQTIEIPTSTFEGGCAKMFIWSAEASGKLLWCGIIPLGGKNPIKIDAKNKIKVLIDDGELPQCPDESTKSRMRENFEAVPEKTRPTWWWVILFLTLLFGVYLLKYHYI